MIFTYEYIWKSVHKGSSERLQLVVLRPKT